ncbi:hypothetical protein R6Q59_001881 [Mikania micrantha]
MFYKTSIYKNQLELSNKCFTSAQRVRMDISSGSHFTISVNQPSTKTIPPRQQVRSGVLHSSLSLVPPPDTSGSPNVQEHGSNFDQVHESPIASASYLDTWSDSLITSKQLNRETKKSMKQFC